MKSMNPLDQLINTADAALRTVFATPHASRPCPTLPAQATQLSDVEKKHAAGLMRVNHVGEVCAQALYAAQALMADATKNEAARAQFTAAAAEETDHLAWTAQRLQELGARPSLLNPLWYAGAFALGLVAGRAGNAISQGFVLETERQVEAHLDSHLNAPDAGGLPAADHASRAIVAQMKDDEARHAAAAQTHGAAELPAPVKALMRRMARVMTTLAYRV
jgi:3-demethoxyubiquinol 3-hydroxylase